MHVSNIFWIQKVHIYKAQNASFLSVVTVDGYFMEQTLHNLHWYWPDQAM